MHQPYMLFVDDDPDEIEMAMEYFREMDMEHRMHCAHNGREALTFLEQAYSTGHLPALMVLDMNMPKMSGIEMLKALRDAGKFQAIPVYIHSTAVNEVTKALCEFLGVTDFIYKGRDMALKKLVEEVGRL